MYECDGQMDVFDFVGNSSAEVELQSKVEEDSITKEIEKNFDYSVEGGW